MLNRWCVNVVSYFVKRYWITEDENQTFATKIHFYSLTFETLQVLFIQSTCTRSKISENII